MQIQLERMHSKSTLLIAIVRAQLIMDQITVMETNVNSVIQLWSMDVLNADSDIQMVCRDVMNAQLEDITLTVLELLYVSPRLNVTPNLTLVLYNKL